MSNWRRESVTAGLVALVLGATAAGLASAASDAVGPPAVTGGVAMPDERVIAGLAALHDSRAS
ncbi:MAG TPA: hypothetical protein VGD67_25375, partial [Pseudonocardiaceae bacterium]